MVVYSILTTNSDTQYVRIYSTYNPPDNDPMRNADEISVQDAQVSITQEEGPTFSFQPMTIPRAGESRYLFTQALFYVVQFDVALWNYYSVANMFRDKLSVRTDEPDYTNINNGTGVFGSTTVDSLVWPIPHFIPHPPPGCQ
jgi:hypothetical protein